jgi:DNA-binding NtrC family response regulator
MDQTTLWAELGLNKSLRVLIIEDHRSFAQLLTQTLTSQGHFVTTIAGVESCQDGVLMGVEPNVSLRLSEFDVCFLDHYFEGIAYTGSTISPLLVNAGIVICGMSSVDSANRAMLAQGARIALLKSRLEALL